MAETESREMLAGSEPGTIRPGAESPTESPPPAVAVAPTGQASQASTVADQLRASAALSQADRTTIPYTVIGPNTKNFVDLYNFYKAAGWNDVVDGLTMKSCPEGYEMFCEMRDVFIKLYQQVGGDPETIVELFQALDLRDEVYQLAVTADQQYQQQYTQPQGANSPD